MRRAFLLVGLLVVVALGGWWFFSTRGTVGSEHLVVYYTAADGTTLQHWTVSVRPRQSGESDAEHLHNVALYAAVQALAGPPSDVPAVRFPAGTHVVNVTVDGNIATVDLSGNVGGTGGSYQESGEFKGLVYTLTGISPINAVQILLEGRNVETLPGGHLELDQPLRRSDW